jgi:hypothetical protein
MKDHGYCSVKLLLTEGLSASGLFDCKVTFPTRVIQAQAKAITPANKLMYVIVFDINTNSFRGRNRVHIIARV